MARYPPFNWWIKHKDAQSWTRNVLWCCMDIIIQFIIQIYSTETKFKFYLWELALLINKGNDIHRFHGNHIQSVLVVSEFDVLPVDILQVVLLLLNFENMANEELLQVLVCKVDAQLLKTTARMNKISTSLSRKCWKKNFLFSKTHLLIVKFSKPKMSSRPIDLRIVLLSEEGTLKMAALILSTIQTNNLP